MIGKRCARQKSFSGNVNGAPRLKSPGITSMASKQLSPHFSYDELTTTELRQFIELNRGMGVNHIPQLKKVCVDLLEPIRAKWGPVIIHSGYRCPDLNKAVGSSNRSQHLLGQAADFHVLGRRNGPPLRDVWAWIWQESELLFHQVIWEMSSWIHISSTTGYNDGQIMDYNNFKYTKYKNVNGLLKPY